MGGFLYNGCGATDSYKTLRRLGAHRCPTCNSEQEFTLEEVKRKIRVVWIPTVTWSVKYAVMCTRCECGAYIDEAMRDKLLYENAQMELTPEGVRLSLPANDPRTACPSCGAAIPDTAAFCPFCGASARQQAGSPA